MGPSRLARIAAGLVASGLAATGLGLGLGLVPACGGGGSGGAVSDSGSASDGIARPDGVTGGDGRANGDGGSGPDGTLPGKDGAGGSAAASFAGKLGAAHAGHFLVGMGNDSTNVYNLGVTLDLHYEYLVGLSTEGGWPTWNTNPDYAADLIAGAVSHGVVPMFAYYCMAAHGENNLPGSVGDMAYMTVWFKDYVELVADIKTAAVPTVVLVEPDFWGFSEQAAINAGGPDKIPAMVSASGAAECSGEPQTLVGFAHCIIKLARRAPTMLVGLHASGWGSKMDIDSNTDPNLDIAGEASKSIAFFKAIGGDQADFVSTDVIDRDAGCYEVAGPNCGTTPRTGVYWDETNAALPNFHQELTWATAMTAGLGLPMIWWQLPFGAPSSMPGGTPGHFRDNRVHYMFTHVGEYVAAGGVGAVWGTGAGSQTDVTSDNGEYTAAAKAYFQAPAPLP